MKQNISKEQWNELSDEQQRRFVEVVQPLIIAGIKTESINHSLELWGRKKPLELPSIGQMIEFLGDDLDRIDITTDNTYKVFYMETISKNKELADALWSACKERLNKL